VRHNGISVSGKVTRKTIVKVLQEGIRPTNLRQAVVMELRNKDIRDDINYFWDTLNHWAPIQERFHIIEKHQENKVANDQSGSSRPMSTSGTLRKRVFIPSRGDKENNFTQTKKTRYPCLFCSKSSHHTKDHRGKTKEQVDEVFKKFRDNVSISQSISYTNSVPLESEGKNGEKIILPQQKLKVEEFVNKFVNNDNEDNKNVLFIRALNTKTG
jgi:hypothetical protein